jgi:flagellar biogenesis protein FliO
VGALVVLLKIGMVFGLLAAVLFVLKKTDSLGTRGRGGLLEVRGSTRLGKGATLTAVRVDGRDLLLGVTDHTVTLLTSEPAQSDGEPTPRPVTQTLPRTAGALRAAVPGLLRRTGSTNLPDDAVAAALASLRGETPRATDGPVASLRTDARPAEEQPCADPAVA